MWTGYSYEIVKGRVKSLLFSIHEHVNMNVRLVIITTAYGQMLLFLCLLSIFQYDYKETIVVQWNSVSNNYGYGFDLYSGKLFIIFCLNTQYDVEFRYSTSSILNSGYKLRTECLKTRNFVTCKTRKK